MFGCHIGWTKNSKITLFKPCSNDPSEGFAVLLAFMVFGAYGMGDVNTEENHEDAEIDISRVSHFQGSFLDLLIKGK